MGACQEWELGSTVVLVWCRSFLSGSVWFLPMVLGIPQESVLSPPKQLGDIIAGVGLCCH